MDCIPFFYRLILYCNPFGGLMLTELTALSHTFLSSRTREYKRYFYDAERKLHRLSILLGERGVGKTTTMIQYLMEYAKQKVTATNVLYVQADHFLVQNKSLYEIAEYFFQHGGEFIAFDEIHKYPNWSQELKSIYDTFADLKIFASGSSVLEISKGSHDLSRRGIQYHLHGLSFREFCELKYGFNIPPTTLSALLTHHREIAHEVLRQFSEKKLKVFSVFSDFLKNGFYPYFLEFNDPENFYIALEQNIHATIESDLLAIHPQLTGNSINKLKKLLAFIAHSVPFTVNWLKLRNIIEIGDDRTVKSYLKYLEDAGLIMTLTKASHKLNKLEAPEKIMLGNTNLLYALSKENANIGSLRETFFLSQISCQHEITLPTNGDFLIDDTHLFEIGGRKKTFNQIKNQKNAYLAVDDLEIGLENKIPLWLFGLLY
jgi:predicted AAA+ superfamily ATPase